MTDKEWKKRYRELQAEVERLRSALEFLRDTHAFDDHARRVIDEALWRKDV